MQVLGRPFTEAMLLTVGQAYESATDWAKLAPSL
jgi:Asp-tRNA(Asn)/Glu-tRNA(Gln) amidotransferase A subunit family amidase